MQRRDFLRSGLLLGATGTVPGAALAASQLANAPPTRTGLVLPPLNDSEMFGFLIHAIEQGLLEVIKSLVRQGANVQADDGFGLTPLHHAACSNSYDDILAYLVSQGANVHAKDGSGRTPLHVATDHIDAVKYLVLQDADVNARDIFDSTPLHNAAQHRPRIEVMEYLIFHGADVNAEDKDGNTPLHDAAQFHSRYEVLECILSQGAEVNAKNNVGKTALSFTWDRIRNCKNYAEFARLKNSIDLLSRTAGESAEEQRKREILLQVYYMK